MKFTVPTRRFSLLSLAAAAGMFAASIGAPAYAALSWYDGFAIDDANPGDATTYLSTQSHHLQTGGSGTFFTGSWLQSDFNPAVGNLVPEINVPTGDPPVNVNSNHPDTWSQPGSLTRLGQSLPSTGDKASDGPGIGFGGDPCCHTSRTGLEMTQDLQSMEGTVYMSFLVNFGTGPNPLDSQYRAVEFWNNGVNDPQLNMSIGVSTFGNYNDPLNDADGPGGVTANRQISVRIDGVREEFGLPVETHHQLGEHIEFADQIGETHEVVIKFDLHTDEIGLVTGAPGDTVSFFLDPTLADVVEPTPSLVVSGIDLEIDRISSIILFHFQGVQANPGAFDELRVGTTWGEVAILSNVPEPATISLLGLGAIGFVLSARRKRG